MQKNRRKLETEGQPLLVETENSHRGGRAKQKLREKKERKHRSEWTGDLSLKEYSSSLKVPVGEDKAGNILIAQHGYVTLFV